MLASFLRLLGVLAMTALLVAAAVVSGGQGSVLANPLADVNCEQQPTHPVCDVEAGSPGESVSVDSGGGVKCFDAVGEQAECYVEGQGWIGADGCRYLSLGSGDPPSDAPGPGVWYQRTCRTSSGAAAEVVWLPDGQAPGLAALGRVAASRLVLPRPVVW